MHAALVSCMLWTKVPPAQIWFSYVISPSIWAFHVALLCLRGRRGLCLRARVQQHRIAIANTYTSDLQRYMRGAGCAHEKEATRVARREK